MSLFKNVDAMEVTDIPIWERKNSEWSVCVFSFKFLMPVETVESEGNIRKLQEVLSVVFSFSVTHI